MSGAVGRRHLEAWPALATLCAVLFLTFLDNTVVSVALADIQTTLHSGVTQLQWIVDGYLLAFAAAVLPENADPQGRRLDVVGLVLGAVGVTAATFAVIEGESAGYTTWWIVVLFAVAAAAAAAFVVVERRSADPVLRLEFFRKRGFAVANVVAFATSFGIFAVFFFTALYLQLVGGFSGWKVALQFVSMAAAIVIAAPLAGAWTARRGPREPLPAG